MFLPLARARDLAVRSLSLSLPGPDSPLRRLDPRWKLAALVLAACAVTLLRTALPSLLALLSAVGLVWLGRLPPRWCLSRLGAIVLAVGPFLFLVPFFSHGDEVPWQFGPVAVSPSGVQTALVLGLKTLALALLVLVLLATSPLTDIFKAAQQLCVPNLLVQLAVLAYRYLFVLAAELARLRVALRVRGYRNRASLHSYRTVGHVGGILLVRGYEQAERVGQAMRCRGFDGRFRTLTAYRTGPRDVLVFTCLMGGSAALLAWDLLRRG